MYQLTGEYECKIDAKGRIKLPANLIRQISTEGAYDFMVNRGFENHLMLYPRDVWERKTKELNQLNIYIKKNREAVRYFYRGATSLTTDASDRILLPKLNTRVSKKRQCFSLIKNKLKSGQKRHMRI